MTFTNKIVEFVVFGEYLIKQNKHENVTLWLSSLEYVELISFDIPPEGKKDYQQG